MNSRSILNNIQSLSPSLTYLLSKLVPSNNILYGAKYRNFKKEYLLNYQNFNSEDLLTSIVNHAISNVPYYSSLYNSIKISSVSDFQLKIRQIDKQIVNDNFDRFFALNQNKKNYDLLTTGGTSGTPLKLFLPKSRYIQELGILHSMWNKGFNYNGEYKAIIKNHRINETFLLNPITKEFIFDGFDFSDDYFEKAYSIIYQNKIPYIFCYPSSGFEFAKFLFKKNKNINFIKAFIATSENVNDFQKNYISQTLGIKFFTFYGHTEKLVCAGYCANSDYYHVEPLYGFCELLDEKNNQINKKGQIGEIVGTSFYNYGMPLIRYRTGDYAEYYGEECPSCGRKVQIFSKILGRWGGDKIYNNDNTYVTTTSLNLHDDLYLSIEGLQYYQPQKGVLHVRIIPNSIFNSSFRDSILKHYKSKLNSDTMVHLDIMETLQRLPNGKFLLLISDVK